MSYKVTESEEYVLGLLVEEGGEIAQLAGKGFRFGLDTPGVKRMDGTIDMNLTPRKALAIECGDMLAAIEFSVEHGFVDGHAMVEAYKSKLSRLLDPDARDNMGRPLAPQPESMK